MNAQRLTTKLATRYPNHGFSLISARHAATLPSWGDMPTLDHGAGLPAFIIVFNDRVTGALVYDPRHQANGQAVLDYPARWGIDLDAVCLIVAYNFPTQLHEMVGERFAAELADELGAERFLEVRRRNHLQQDPGVCHSHDFCDANLTMMRAMEACGQQVFTRGQINDATTATWNRAWAFAKARFLTCRKRVAS